MYFLYIKNIYSNTDKNKNKNNNNNNNDDNNNNKNDATFNVKRQL
jgi:hypothetical protein